MPELEHGESAPNELFGGVGEQEAPPEDIAYERGVEDGRASASNELGRGFKRSLATLSNAADALLEARGECVGEMEEAALVLAIAVARQVIQREVTSDPKVIRDIVRRAISHVEWDSSIEVRLHPEDIATVKEQIGQLESATMPDSIEWIPDVSVGRGGCAVSTPSRLVDGSLDTVLQDMYEALAHG